MIEATGNGKKNDSDTAPGHTVSDRGEAIEFFNGGLHQMTGAGEDALRTAGIAQRIESNPGARIQYSILNGRRRLTATADCRRHRDRLDARFLNRVSFSTEGSDGRNSL